LIIIFWRTFLVRFLLFLESKSHFLIFKTLQKLLILSCFYLDFISVYW